MAKVLEMPKLSPTMEEGQISTWHKKEGDDVAVDDLLAEVETDKATMEFRAFDKGTLLKILAPAGTIVKLGAPVAVLGKAGEDVSQWSGSEGKRDTDQGKQAAEQEKQVAGQEKQVAVQEKQVAVQEKQVAVQEKQVADQGKQVANQGKQVANQEKQVADQEKQVADQGKQVADQEKQVADQKNQVADQGKRDAAQAKSEANEGRVKASPYVRKLARENDLDLRGVAGSGPNGRIVARDLADRPPTPARSPQAGEAGRGSAAVSREDEARPLSMMRKTIARRLTESKQTVPHFYLTIDADADALFTLRERINEDLVGSAKKGEEPLKISVNDLLVKACAVALVRVPECNASFTPEAILLHRRVDISVAVAVAEGLVTPVVRDADRKGVLAIAAEVRELAGRAKQKKLKPEEMSDGTFSISNLGMYGIDTFAAVINPPEGAILAVGQIRREPVVRGDEVVAGRKLAMTLSCDHRVVDGAIGATFLKALRQLVEHPTQILL